MKYGCESINGGANTVASSACWTRFDYPSLEAKEIVAYCVDNLIAIVDVSQSIVTETLRGHSKRVNALKSTKHFLVSASEDATVQIWNLNDHGKWKQHAILSGIMRGSIITLSCLDSTSGLLIAASDVTGRVAIWLQRNESNIFSVIQVVDMPPSQMPHDLHLAESPGSGPVGVDGYHTGDLDVLLFLGGVDSRIHIRTASQQSISNSSVISNSPIAASIETSTEDVFKMVGVLAGHEEWVTCLTSVASDSRTLLLSSGSKDAKIRIWRLHNSSRQSIASNSVDLQQINGYNKSKIEDEEEEEEEVDEIDAPEGAVMLEPDESLSEARLIFDTPSGSVCSVFLEALLIGHEDWVTSVHWMVNKDITELKGEDTVSGKESEDKNNEIERSRIDHRLYSTSMDRYYDDININCIVIVSHNVFIIFNDMKNSIILSHSLV